MPITTKQKIKIAKILAGCLRAARGAVGAPSKIVDVTRNGIKWRLDLREGIDLYIYLFGVFEWATVRAYSRLIKPGDVVLDVGANIGAHTLQFARLVGPTGHVYAFEPTKYAYDKLNINVGLNPRLAPSICAMQTMLVDTEGSGLPSQLYSSWPLYNSENLHNQHGGFPKSTSGAIATTLDEALLRSGIDKVSFVKLDVDGYECDVLEGWKTIERFKPKILFELAGQDSHTSRLLSLLSGCGYQFVSLATNEVVEKNALLRRLKPGSSINVLARPVIPPGVGSSSSAG